MIYPLSHSLFDLNMEKLLAPPRHSRTTTIIVVVFASLPKPLRLSEDDDESLGGWRVLMVYGLVR